MSANISNEEFCRLQNQILELKTANYKLEDQCKRHLIELESSQKRASLVNTELEKAQKIITRSKKAREVEVLVQENDRLQQKLLSQEEDFGLQNKTLLQELASLVSCNESYEKEIEGLKSKIAENNASGVTEEEDGTRITEEEDGIRKLRAQNAVLRKSIDQSQKELKIAYSMMATDPLQRCQVLENCNGALGDDEQVQNNQNKFHEQLAEVTLELDTEKEEKRLLSEKVEQMKIETASVKEQLDKANEKLKKKQDSIMQLQKERENDFNKNRLKLESVTGEKDAELTKLREMCQRNQTLLANTQQSLAEQKARYQQEVIELTEQLKSCSGEKVQELSAQKIVLVEELRTANASSEKCKSELQELKRSLEELQSSHGEACQQINALQTQNTSLKTDLTEADKLAEKRRLLIEEMAQTLRQKAEDHDKQLAEKEDERQDLQNKLGSVQERNRLLEPLESTLIDLKKQICEKEQQIDELEKKVQEAADALVCTKQEFEASVAMLQANHTSELQTIRQSYETKLKDLEIQIQMIGAQKSEFEEKSKMLGQQIQDGMEERKIHERKGIGMVRDLKKQLTTERKRADKLQERLSQLLSEGNIGGRSEVVGPVEPDVGSNSSWSLMSGNGNGSGRDTHTPTSGSSPEHTRELDELTAEEQLSTLQQTNSQLEQRLSMLEESSAAMAEELLSKQAIIQFYCMETRAGPVNAPSTKLTAKKVKDFLKSVGDESTRETNKKLQRMLEETLTKNMHLQGNLEQLSTELAELKNLSKNLYEL